MPLKLNNLKPAKGATRKRKRIGRGEGSGQGTTAGRGHKGQKSRSGYSRRFGFEGGQMPLIRRLPKRGFSNYPFKLHYSEVNVARLNELDAGTEVTPELLAQRRMIRKMRDGVKILGGGDLEVSLTVQAHKFTAGAREKIEAAGGTVVELARVAAAKAEAPAEEVAAAPEAAPETDEASSEAAAGEGSESSDEPEAAAGESPESSEESEQTRDSDPPADEADEQE